MGLSKEKIGKVMKPRSQSKRKSIRQGFWLRNSYNGEGKPASFNLSYISVDRKHEMKFLQTSKNYKLSKFLKNPSVNKMIYALIQEKNFLAEHIAREWDEYVKLLFYELDYKREELILEYKLVAPMSMIRASRLQLFQGFLIRLPQYSIIFCK